MKNMTQKSRLYVGITSQHLDLPQRCPWEHSARITQFPSPTVHSSEGSTSLGKSRYGVNHSMASESSEHHKRERQPGGDTNFMFHKTLGKTRTPEGRKRSLILIKY